MVCFPDVHLTHAPVCRDPSKPTFHVSVYLVAAGRSTTDSIQARVIEAAGELPFYSTDHCSQPVDMNARR